MRFVPQPRFRVAHALRRWSLAWVTRRRLEARLVERNLVLAHAERMAALGSWQWTPEDGRVVWSDNLYRLLGYAPEEVVPSHELFLKHVHGEDRDRVAAAMRCLDSENECEPVELRIVRRDGAERRLFATMAAFSHEGEVLRRRVGSVQDVTERKRLEAELTHRALHDPLTGLPNRRLLLDRLDHALERNARAGERVALLLADIDDFKAINDGLGHEAGDQLLVRIAPRLVAAMRQSDTVGRFGGDEFVVICEGLKDPQNALALAERFATAWSEPFEIAGELLSVTASAGVALAAPHDDSAALLRRADAAMYRDKDDRHGPPASER